MVEEIAQGRIKLTLNLGLRLVGAAQGFKPGLQIPNPGLLKGGQLSGLQQFSPRRGKV